MRRRRPDLGRGMHDPRCHLIRRLQPEPREGRKNAIGKFVEIGLVILRRLAVLDRIPEGEVHGLRIEHRAGRRGHRGGHEIERRGQRRRIPGHLLAVGGRQHLAAHLLEDVVDAGAGLGDGTRQRRRIGAVAAFAVFGHVVRRGRIGDEAAHRPHRWIGKAAGDRAEAARQRIVAAGIEDHDVDRGFREGHLLHHQIDRNGLDIDIAFARDPGVNRNEIIGAGDLQPRARHRRTARLRRRPRPPAAR